MKTIAAVIIYKGRFYKSPECMYIIMSGPDYGAVLVRHGGLPAIVYVISNVNCKRSCAQRNGRLTDDDTNDDYNSYCNYNEKRNNIIIIILAVAFKDEKLNDRHSHSSLSAVRMCACTQVLRRAYSRKLGVHISVPSENVLSILRRPTRRSKHR